MQFTRIRYLYQRRGNLMSANQIPAEEWSRMHEHHALPDGWHTMTYDTFLIERRKLMAAIIRKGFESLK